ncbi:transposase [Streptomyces sp. PanSC9]|uniref:transposase n=1 Tax=Streptomyces sp. PanSC9 TaxID=1520461 RepID=UPI000F4AE322|nr:DDE family transposase [Streptomyces sp. PanSC9]
MHQERRVKGPRLSPLPRDPGSGCGIERAFRRLVSLADRRRKGRQGGRPPTFDREAHKRRNTVERCINRVKIWRGLATRCEKTATVFQAGPHVAGIFIRSAR